MTLRSNSEGPNAFLKKAQSREKGTSASGDTAARVICEVSAKALKHNYLAIQELVPDQAILPMIKAGAYGHGAAWAVRELSEMRGLYGFGVATFEEGIEIRRALGPGSHRTSIIIFSGAVSWTEEKGQLSEKHGLTPVIAADRDWPLFLRGGWHLKIPFELKFNTGMNRLGLSPGLARTIVKNLKSKSGPGEIQLSGILSHLAMGETPAAPLSRTQLDQFTWIKKEMAPAFPSAHFHLANSAGIWNRKLWDLDGLTDVVRPGLSLYGIPPWKGAPEKGIMPVMTLRANVLEVRKLKPGDRLGYGGTYSPKEATTVAILAGGYADGIKRALSNRGYVWLGGKSERFVGIVSMDLCAVTCDSRIKPGDWAEILGPHVDPWAQALAGETLPYELLTSVSSRVQRVLG